MMRARHWTYVAGALILAAANAYAGTGSGQVTLYEGPDFNGRSVIANADVSYVKRWGFGDSAASIVVSEGVWEACTDPWYKGRCVQLPPGNYRRIDVTLNEPITSVRQLASSDRVALVPAPAVVVAAPVTTTQLATVTAPVVVNSAPVVVSPQPAVGTPTVVAPAQSVVVASQAVAVAPSTGRIVLYEFPNFGGVQAAVDHGQAKDLDWAHFGNANHRATSIRVESGTWIVCTDIAFRGECRVLDPGDYPQLAGGLSVGVSSAQQVWRPEYGALPVYTR